MANNLEGFIWVPEVKLHVATGLLTVPKKILDEASKIAERLKDKDLIESLGFTKNLSDDREYTHITLKEAGPILECIRKLDEYKGSRIMTQKEHGIVAECASKSREELYISLITTPGPEIVCGPEGLVYATTFLPLKNGRLQINYTKNPGLVDSGIRLVIS